MFIVAVAFLQTGMGSAVAEMDDRSYTPHRSSSPQGEMERVRRQIDEEKAIDARRAAESARAEEEAERRLAAANSARPRGERLLELRCRSCHGPENFDNARFGWIGWHATILRMRFVNGAELCWGEHFLIAQHLLETRAATKLQQTIEWVMAVAFLASVVGFMTWLRRWWLG